MSSNVFSGARCTFRIDGKIVAYASGVDGSEEIMYEPVDVLDNIEVAEYVPVGYRVTMNCAIFRTIAGWRALRGGGPNRPADGQLGSIKDPNVGIVPRAGMSPSEILTSGYMSATIMDHLTKKVIYKFEEVKAQSHNFSVTARGIVATNCAFNCIRLKDESSPGL